MAVKLSCSHCGSMLTIAVVDGNVEITHVEPPAKNLDPDKTDNDLLEELIGGSDSDGSEA